MLCFWATVTNGLSSACYCAQATLECILLPVMPELLETICTPKCKYMHQTWRLGGLVLGHEVAIRH